MIDIPRLTDYELGHILAQLGAALLTGQYELVPKQPAQQIVQQRSTSPVSSMQPAAFHEDRQSATPDPTVDSQRHARPVAPPLAPGRRLRRNRDRLDYRLKAMKRMPDTSDLTPLAHELIELLRRDWHTVTSAAIRLNAKRKTITNLMSLLGKRGLIESRPALDAPLR